MQRGFSLVIVLILAGALVLASGAYYLGTRRSDTLLPTSIPTSEKILDFETIKVKKFTDYSKTVTEPLVINNMDEWNKIINQPEIHVDFRNETVLAAFFNAKTGGYSIKISKISDEGDYIEAVVEQTSPGKGCLVTQALEFKSHLVKLQKITKTVKFKAENIMYDCID